MKKNVTVIHDLQFGSTGKGLIAGYLAEKEAPDVIVTSWGPNSGHTYIDQIGRTFIHTMLANGVVSPKAEFILIGPGSVVNMDSLIAEIKAAKEQGVPIGSSIQILIHPNTAIVSQKHRDIEGATMTGIGSTKKGSGAALIEKIERQRGSRVAAKDAIFDDPRIGDFLIPARDYDAIIDQAGQIQVEGAQGYSLGINSGFYPFTTFRECSTAQILSDCLIPFNRVKRVIGTARTYPIRVANRYDADGKEIGNSGPCYPDQEELQWKDIGIETPELTTVTKLPRRLFTFSEEQFEKAIRLNGTTDVFLNFVNYLTVHDRTPFLARANEIARRNGAKISWLGHGATAQDVTEWGFAP